jgi:uncharacterized protein
VTTLEIPVQEVLRRFTMDNPWWRAGSGIDIDENSWPRRDYFGAFVRVVEADVRRATLLIGPRRVGKTVMLKHLVARLLERGVSGTQVLYVSLDTPMYTGRSLEGLVRMFLELQQHPPTQPLWIIFDEVQYLHQWEVHLKSLVDSFRNIRFLASGSGAAALRGKSLESGAGRFTEFMLPPLTFAEYLRFAGQEGALIREVNGRPNSAASYVANDITALNQEFVNYLNFGGFPEAVMTPSVRANPARFLRQDVVEKVLLKDLPSLYGIGNVQELNQFFNVLAFNTGNEWNVEAMSQHSRIAKHRVGEYLEYLEAAFLIRRVHRLDNNAMRMQRARTFKVYLTNPSMRAALFGMARADDDAMGRLAETAVWGQWLHNILTSQSLHYARWKSGRQDLEVDFVLLDPHTQKPRFALEVKWSDRGPDTLKEYRALCELAQQHKLAAPLRATTRSLTAEATRDGNLIQFTPTALYCYSIGREMISSE